MLTIQGPKGGGFCDGISRRGFLRIGTLAMGGAVLNLSDLFRARGASTLGPPNLAGVLAFQRVLVDAGYSCFIRRRRGDDVSAACGQLALLGAKPKVRVNRS